MKLGGGQRNRNRNLAKRRHLCGLTQHQLAEVSGVPLSRISYAESGRVTLELEELDRIASALKRRAAKAMDAIAKEA